MSPGDLAEALAVLPLPNNCGAIPIEGWTADMLAF